MSDQAPIFTDTFALCEWLLQHLDREPGVLARSICDRALQLLESITFALKDRAGISPSRKLRRAMPRRLRASANKGHDALVRSLTSYRGLWVF